MDYSHFVIAVRAHAVCYHWERGRQPYLFGLFNRFLDTSEPGAAMASQMRLSTKLVIAFGLLIAVQVSGNCISLLMLQKVDTAVIDLETNWLPSIDSISAIDRQYQTFRRSELLHVLSTDDATMKDYDNRLATSLTDLKKTWQHMKN